MADEVVEVEGLDTPEVVAVEDKPKKRKPRVKVDMDESVTDLLKPKKVKKVKEPVQYKTVKETLLEGLATVNIEEAKKPWMATKTFRLITDPEELREWVQRALSNTSKHFKAPNGELLPVIAVDTETTGLDTRIVEGQINVDIAGICLSSDGIEGIYVPITHEDDENLDRIECAKILQELFDQSFLVFFNAKFDREILRVTMGITFREYPYFEDVQVFNFLLDPKADVDAGGGKAGAMAQGGLKALSKKHLDMEQIELDEFTKVKVKLPNKVTGKTSVKSVYAPFNMVPTSIALWYAASDAICTWLLWSKLYKRARAIEMAHEIDHELVDSLSWIERQRYYIDLERLRKTIKWQQQKLEALRNDMIAISGVEGLNPGSSPQLAKILFQDRGFKPYKTSEKTGLPSTDGETMEELSKQNPDDPFLKKLMEYKEYAALHPENLTVDPRDGSARVFLKQCTVAGGRLAANGGDFEKDGGFGLNIQAIKAVGGNKWVKGRLLLEDIEDINLDDLPGYSIEDLHPTAVEEVPESYTDGSGKTLKRVSKVARKGIIKNHIASWLGYTFCLVPGCKYCKEKFTVLKESTKGDANEVLNLRSLFVAQPGWTFYTIDYSNIEMRCAANASLEPRFVNEFIHGEGDFHSLTATLVFPEFSTTTDKVRKKQLRSMAKILNFALLYGGTEHSIYEQLKKAVPDMTMEKARAMVVAYWEGVPVFAEWVKKQKALAENEFLILTGTGREIHFESTMEQMRIKTPDDADKEYYWRYRNARKKANEYRELSEALRAEGAPAYEIKEAKDRAAQSDEQALALWRDERTGVRNYADYNRFIGKIGRLSMNIPLQGLAGDMMRLSLNRIRKWAMSDVGVENVLRMHGSVHDEIDPSVKNEYAPYVIPRLTRLMKLRDLHAERNWPVPIETDIEFGQSWDISFHMTGDKDHLPSGYCDVPGMDNYIPMEWGEEFKSLEAMSQTSEGRERLVKGLTKSLHERVKMAIDLLRDSKTPEDARHWLIVALQLDEYWRIDEGEEPCTFNEFEAYYGLSRPPLPIGGFLGAMPFDLLEKHEQARIANLQMARNIIILSKEDQEKLAEAILNPPPLAPAMVEAMSRRDELLSQEFHSRPVEMLYSVSSDAGYGKPVEIIPGQPQLKVPSQELTEDDEDPFAPQPKKKVTKEDSPEPISLPIEVEKEKSRVKEGEVLVKVGYHQGIPCLRFMDEEDLEELMRYLGRGNKTLRVVYCGEIYEIQNVSKVEIPNEYAFRLDQLERIEHGEAGLEGFKLED